MLFAIQSLNSGVMNVACFPPLIRMKKIILVSAIPLHKNPHLLNFSL